MPSCSRECRQDNARSYHAHYRVSRSFDASPIACPPSLLNPPDQERQADEGYQETDEIDAQEPTNVELSTLAKVSHVACRIMAVTNATPTLQ